MHSGLQDRGTDETSERIAGVAPELGQALDDIHAAAPNAEVFVVSYPTALRDNGVACWPYLPILPEDMPYLVEKFKENKRDRRASEPPRRDLHRHLHAEHRPRPRARYRGSHG